MVCLSNNDPLITTLASLNFSYNTLTIFQQYQWKKPNKTTSLPKGTENPNLFPIIQSGPLRLSNIISIISMTFLYDEGIIVIVVIVLIGWFG